MANVAVGLCSGAFIRQESTKLLKSVDQCVSDNEGASFCGMWYNAAIAFILNNGGLPSAVITSYTFIWQSNNQIKRFVLCYVS